MTDGDLVARVQARAETNLFWRHLGVSVVDAKPGWVRLRVPVRDDIKNAAGAPVHGGVYSALVDMAVGLTLGAAFGAFAASFVADVFSPPLGLLLGGVDFSNMFILLRDGVKEAGPYASLG